MIPDNIKQEDIIAILATWLKAEKERREELEKVAASASSANRKKNEMLASTGDIISELKRQVAEKDAQIKERDEYIKDAEQRIARHCDSAKDEPSLLNKLNALFIGLDNYKQRVRERSKEAESYRRLYSELEGAILDTAATRTGFVPTENPTNSFLLMTIKSEIIDYNELEKEVDRLRNDCFEAGKKRQHWQNKYKRLTAIINRHPNEKAKLVLNSHREQEKKK